MAGVSEFAIGDEDDDDDDRDEDADKGEEGSGAGKRSQSQVASPYGDLDDRDVWGEEGSGRTN